MNFICQRFGTLCLFHLHKPVGMKSNYPSMKMEQTEGSETLSYKIQLPGNYQQDSTQHSFQISVKIHLSAVKSFIILSEFHFYSNLYLNRNRLTSRTWFYILNSVFLTSAL